MDSGFGLGVTKGYQQLDHSLSLSEFFSNDEGSPQFPTYFFWLRQEAQELTPCVCDSSLTLYKRKVLRLVYIFLEQVK